MIEIVLVRHAQPDWEPGGRAVDHPELSGHGRRQAEAVADVEALTNRIDELVKIVARRAELTEDSNVRLVLLHRVGDKVALAPSRPLSRRKRWVVTRIVERAKEI